MEIIIKYIEIIKRMDLLIHLQATGTPEEFASRLEVSKTKLYRMIKVIKRLNAPIKYDHFLQSFVYTEAVGFTFGFYPRYQNHKKSRPIRIRFRE
ncbi:hypothetical protein [Aquimarina macrocephali]|uniref:hypothetical protein n=1 Tax=Aquimarina macrocephali TaxID=666563 RepID=UPI00046455A3|nr:hypothetical protein [Aquimarina macrocephali]